MQKQITQQRGATLIIFAVIVSLIVLTIIFQHLNGKQLEALRKDKTAKALYEAKTALLGWSVLGGTNADRPGQLPCPEDTTLIGTVTEGDEMVSCNSALPVVGRLPWRTLGLGDLRDGNGDRLWYALSPGFRNAPINFTTVGQINVNGIPNAVAIIFSPGKVLAGQNRANPTAISPPLVADYLDLTNNNGDVSYSSIGPANTFNDGLLVVMQTELFKLVERRILREIRGNSTQGLFKFYTTNTNYAFADTDDNGSSDGANHGTPSYQSTNNVDPNDIYFTPATLNVLVSNDWMRNIDYRLLSASSVKMTLNGQTLMVP